jgi:hypothetical protein
VNIAKLPAIAARAISVSISPVTKKTLENHAGAMLPLSGLFLLLHSGSARDVEVKMITAAEYRAWAEESLEWARIATKESSRAAYIQWAETWLELASRVERLTALIEDRSKEPTPTAEWPRNCIEMRIRKRRRSSVTFDQLAFDFAKN